MLKERERRPGSNGKNRTEKAQEGFAFRRLTLLRRRNPAGRLSLCPVPMRRRRISTIWSDADLRLRLYLARGRRADEIQFEKVRSYADIQDGMKMAREEIFGPLPSIIKFRDIDEVIARANKTTYGLAVAIWTRDIGKGHAIAGNVRAGTIWGGGFDVFDVAAPFGDSSGPESAARRANTPSSSPQK